MIVSASYRTDIPAFYGEWFLNRFRAGYAKVVNPYGGKPSTVPLRQGVDGFVFWTRNARPFRDALLEVRRAGIPFMVTYTVTGYPRALETSVIDWERAADDIRSLAQEFGPRAVVWRYDPILVTSLTPAEVHLEAFDRLAEALKGAVDEAVISFATLYRKTERNLAAAARAAKFTWSDPPAEDKRVLASHLSELARVRRMALTVCSQADYTVCGTKPAACVDAHRLEDVARDWGVPRSIHARRKGNRPGCDCFESRDIGDYDTCPHGCTYCYAVGSRTTAKRRYGAHDPEAEYLITPPGADGDGPRLV